MKRGLVKAWNVSTSPKAIEVTALILFVALIVVFLSVLHAVPDPDYTRSEVLRISEVACGALGVVSLLLVWAQLRHGARLNKLLAYHEYFHDLPSTSKVRELYATLARLEIAIPSWQAPLDDAGIKLAVEDKEPPPMKATQVIREYLNDFEEFAAAVKSGLIDEEYAYHLEATRTLNAYFGFRGVVAHWLMEDRKTAEKAGEAAPTATNYYGELRSVAERWKARKQEEAQEALKSQNKGHISSHL
jgi:hypothetical protein